MRRSIKQTSLFLALSLLAIYSFGAYAIDPSMPYRVMETENFTIHYPERAELFAFEAAEKAELAHQMLLPYMSLPPSQKTQVIIYDDIDVANGSANSIPFNKINIFALPPDSEGGLHYFRDWLFSLILHEYVHILHLDTISGFPNAVNKVLGKIYAPNIIQPRFIVEGFAVHIETRLGGNGRNVSSLHKMFARALALAGKDPAIDMTSNNLFDFPYGNIWYIYGGFFIEYLVDLYGPGVLTALAEEYGSKTIPFALNTTFSVVTGKNLLELYDEWKERDRALAVAKLEEIVSSGHIREGEPLTFADDSRAMTTPIRGKEKFLYYSSTKRYTYPQIRVVDYKTKENKLLAEVNNIRGLDYSPSQNLIIASMARLYKEFYYYYDLYEMKLNEAGEVVEKKWITEGARARKPSFSHDGKKIAFISSSGGNSQLCIVEADGRNRNCILESGIDTRIDAPMFSADDRHIYFSMHTVKSEAWEIYRISLESKKIERMTFLGKIATNPFASYDGKWLLFEADPDEVFNAYALELETGKLHKLTNVITGAFEPKLAYDMETLIFTLFSVEGYKAHKIPFEPVFTGHVFKPQDAEVDITEPPIKLKTRRYNPLPTLRPYYWTPVAGYDSFDGFIVGLMVTGQDVLERHSYSAQLSYSSGYKDVLGSFSYTNRSFYPYITLSAEKFNRKLSYEYNRYGRNYGFEEKIWNAGLRVGIPFSSLDDSHNINIAYNAEWMSPNTKYNWPYNFDPLEPTPRLPEFGRLTTLSVSYAFSNVRASGASISSERGSAFRLSLNGSHPLLGSEFDMYYITATFRNYLLMPWLNHHVWALRIAGGAGIGDFESRRIFYIGGQNQGDILLSLIRGDTYRSSGYLRGFPPSVFPTNAFIAMNNDYRLPIWRIYRGVYTLPVFLREISLTGYADTAFSDQSFGNEGGFHASLGAEVDFSATISYTAGMNLKFGVARPVTDDFGFAYYILLGGGF